jgi:hypothetical protein
VLFYIFVSTDVLAASIYAGGVLLIGVGYFFVYRRRCLAQLSQVEVENIDSEAERVVADVRNGAELDGLELADFRPTSFDTRQMVSEPASSEKVQYKKKLTFSKIAQKIPQDGSLRVEETSVSFATTLETNSQH